MQDVFMISFKEDKSFGEELCRVLFCFLRVW